MWDEPGAYWHATCVVNLVEISIFFSRFQYYENMKKWLLITLVLIPSLVFASGNGLNTYYDLATDYLGLPGDCFQMATKYLRDLYQDDSFKIRIADYEKVSYEDASAGDVIYYDSCASRHGGYTTHWAVYLGDGKAFHGNWQAEVIIATPYMNACSTPNFYHLKSLTKHTIEFNLISLEG